MARWQRTKRRATVRLARWLGASLEAWDARPGLRRGAAIGLALVINALLVLTFARMPMRAPPEATGSAPIEIVFLPTPPAPEPEPEPEPVQSEPEPPSEPAPRTPSPRPNPPAADLPDAAGRSGVVALDCKAVFDEEGRAVACAGGDITLGYEVDPNEWDAIAAEVPIYGPRPSADSDATFGDATDDRFATDPDRLRALRREGRARQAEAAAQSASGPSPIATGGAEQGVGQGADFLEPERFIRSYEERRRLAEEEERRRDALRRREMD